MKWALLDFEGKVIRLYNYPAQGTVEIKEPEYKIDWNDYEECLL